jgi:hypothetical protein
LVNAVHAGLLRIHSQRLANKAKWHECIRSAYDVFAAALMESGQPLSEDCLRERIPAWVLKWALAKGWVDAPVKRNPAYSPVRFMDDPRPWQPQNIPVPDHELTLQFGENRITEDYKTEFLRYLETRIVHWQAEVLLTPAPPPVERDSTVEIAPVAVGPIGQQIRRLRIECGWTEEQLAERVGITTRTVQRHLVLCPLEKILKNRFYVELFWPILGIWVAHL